MIFKFQFNSSETESEANLSNNYLKNDDILELKNHRTDNSLEEWILRYDKLLDDSSVNKKYLYEQITGVHNKVGIFESF